MVLYPTITGDGPTFTVSLHDDLNSDPIRSVELHVELEHWAPEDRVQVALDDEILPPPSIRDVAEEDNSDPADVSENKWFVWDLSVNQAAKCEHKIKVILQTRDVRIRVPLIVKHVEIHITYEANS